MGHPIGYRGKGRPFRRQPGVHGYLDAGVFRFWFTALDRPVRYRFDVKTPVLVTADIIVEGDKFRYEQVPQGVADVTFRCHTHLFALLMYGRTKAAEAMAAGHLTMEGDKALAEQFSQWFKGI